MLKDEKSEVIHIAKYPEQDMNSENEENVVRRAYEVYNIGRWSVVWKILK